LAGKNKRVHLEEDFLNQSSHFLVEDNEKYPGRQEYVDHITFGEKFERSRLL
jgi:hypothetical protein